MVQEKGFIPIEEKKNQIIKLYPRKINNCEASQSESL